VTDPQQPRQPGPVPKGTAPAAVEFHDSAFSGGVRVASRWRDLPHRRSRRGV